MSFLIMGLSEQIDLMRAVVSLHPEGEIEDDLVEALRRIVSPHLLQSDSVQSFREARHTTRGESRSGAGQRISDSESIATKSISERSRPQAPTINNEGDRKDSIKSKDPTGPGQLVAIKSVLDLIAEQAGIDLENSAASKRVTGARSTAICAEREVVPVDALFPETRVRSILREMATVPTLSRSLDVEAAVKLVSTGKPFNEVPRHIESALPHSVHWLFDAGPSMLPFTRDKRNLANTALRLLGKDRTRIADFIVDPRKEIRARGEVKWRKMRWPDRHSILVVVSDLGISHGEISQSRASFSWTGFLAEADKRQINTVLLNPYRQFRWPRVAYRFNLAISWDSTTGVQKLRKARRLGS